MPVTDEQVEAAAKAIASAYLEEEKNGGQYDDITPRQLARIALEAGEYNWREIGIIPPNKYEWVLVCNPGVGSLPVIAMSAEDSEWLDTEEEILSVYPTYWQPLPRLPWANTTP